MNTPQALIAPKLNNLLWRWAIVFLVLIAAAFWAAWRLNAAAAGLPDSGAGSSTAVATVAQVAHQAAEPKIEYWTCTMHPQIHQDQSGNCPICGMKLVPKYVGSDEPDVPPAAPTAAAQSAESSAEHAAHAETATPSAAPKMWYRCTMPACGDVGSDVPDSRCPVCGMKREPVGMVGGQTGAASEVSLNERARKLAESASEPVEARSLFKLIRTVGKIEYDETRHKIVSAWINGRVDKLFADFTGMVVTRGDHLVDIYSPELLSAQEEYLQALHAAEEMKSGGNELSQRSADQLLTSTRRKLDLLGVTAEQIADLEQSAKTQTHLVVYAPLGGTIVKKRVMEGMYVKTGDVLYEIADLTQVWLVLDAYESDLPWIQIFQDVRVTAEALPGEEFHGKIAFMDPVVDARTRTIKVRVNIVNPERRLLPEMYVRAEIRVPVGAGGCAAAPPSDAAYACPMHTWETSQTPADCPICQMTMVPIASIPGYKTPESAAKVLSVPRSAVLQTGERSLVYVEAEPGRYRGVDVQVGPLARTEDGAEYFPVLAGLDVGQQVVTRGNFAIDSQMQLAGKPSLLSAATGEVKPTHAEHAPLLEPAPRVNDAEKHVQPPTVEQTLCPVLDNPIEKDVYLDYQGVRIYFCCPPCIDKFKVEPAKYVAKLPAEMQAKIRQAEQAGEKRP